MKTIAFFNVKGGVGKTSSSITVAHILATVHNKKVLLIDLDAQSNTTDFFELYDVPYNVSDALTGKDIKEVIQKTKFNNLDVLPANLTLGRVEKILLADTTTPQQFKLKTALKNIENDYDYCIIDCSPSAESLINTNGLTVADIVFVPLKCDKWATRGLNATIQVVDTISTYNTKLKFGGCFFVQWENRNINKVVYDTLKDELNDKMLDIKIRKNKSVEEITYTQIPLIEYDKNGKATEDYKNLCEKILKIVR